MLTEETIKPLREVITGLVGSRLDENVRAGRAAQDTMAVPWRASRISWAT